MIRHIATLPAAALIVLALASAARADTVTFQGAFGVSASVTNFSLTGSTFTFTVTNTSPSGNLTAIGFDLTGNRLNNFQIVGAANGFTVVFDEAVQAGAVTTLGKNQGVFDLALVTGTSFTNGPGTGGLAPGQSATFTITGDFSNMTAQQIAEALSLRFKGIRPGDASTVAEPVPNAPVPEPATMILLGTGLAGVAAKVRSRRRKAGSVQ